MRNCRYIALALCLLTATPVLVTQICDSAEARKSKRQQLLFRAKPYRTIQSTVAAAAPLANPAQSKGSPKPPNAIVAQFVPPKLTISTDKPRYKTGDLITIGVVADGRCDLTLVGIDSEDFATVLFPNDFDYNNQLNGGELLSFPKINAPYQLRVKAAGTETLLGICSAPGHRPLGISADYDRNRFTQIGDWSDFSINKEAREKEIQKESATAISIARSKRRKLPEPPLPATEVEFESRSVVLVTIE